MKSWTPRSFWAGVLIGAGLALFALWPLTGLISLDHFSYRYIAFPGLGLAVVGYFLR
jgi:hypothetical protein